MLLLVSLEPVCPGFIIFEFLLCIFPLLCMIDRHTYHNTLRIFKYHSRSMKVLLCYVYPLNNLIGPLDTFETVRVARGSETQARFLFSPLLSTSPGYQWLLCKVSNTFLMGYRKPQAAKAKDKSIVQVQDNTST